MAATSLRDTSRMAASTSRRSEATSALLLSSLRAAAASASAARAESARSRADHSAAREVAAEVLASTSTRCWQTQQPHSSRASAGASPLLLGAASSAGSAAQRATELGPRSVAASADERAPLRGLMASVPGLHMAAIICAARAASAQWQPSPPVHPPSPARRSAEHHPRSARRGTVIRPAAHLAAHLGPSGASRPGMRGASKEFAGRSSGPCPARHGESTTSTRCTPKPPERPEARTSAAAPRATERCLALSAAQGTAAAASSAGAPPASMARRRRCSASRVATRPLRSRVPRSKGLTTTASAPRRVDKSESARPRAWSAEPLATGTGVRPEPAAPAARKNSSAMASTRSARSLVARNSPARRTSTGGEGRAMSAYSRATAPGSVAAYRTHMAAARVSSSSWLATARRSRSTRTARRSKPACRPAPAWSCTWTPFT
mmetsp:Transcript_20393/g.68447  ORF Transcript_20393/g.68447 Transcript_20393/m.68447 type:complete len:436 (-) Transcript_20393:791-2098(-)